MFERALFVLVLSPFSLSLTSTFSLSLSTCSLSCTTSTMSSPPRVKTTALTHNEEYCPVAIYNPLTVICMFMSHCTLHFTCPIVSKKKKHHYRTRREEARQQVQQREEQHRNQTVHAKLCTEKIVAPKNGWMEKLQRQAVKHLVLQNHMSSSSSTKSRFRESQCIYTFPKRPKLRSMQKDQTHIHRAENFGDLTIDHKVLNE